MSFKSELYLFLLIIGSLFYIRYSIRYAVKTIWIHHSEPVKTLMESTDTYEDKQFLLSRYNTSWEDHDVFYAAYKRDDPSSGQSAIVYNLLNGKSGGFFVDSGANDGLLISNTYYFEKQLNWSGIAVEPIPVLYKQLVRNRRCFTVQGCLSPVNQSKLMTMVYGSHIGSSRLDLINKLSRYEMSWRFFVQPRRVQVQCYPVDEILEKYKVTEIDFFSLDIEGSELEILKTLSFQRFDVKIFSVEAYFENSTESLVEFFSSKGYVYYAHVISTGTQDDIFVKEEMLNQSLSELPLLFDFFNPTKELFETLPTFNYHVRRAREQLNLTSGFT